MVVLLCFSLQDALLMRPALRSRRIALGRACASTIHEVDDLPSQEIRPLIVDRMSRSVQKQRMTRCHLHLWRYIARVFAEVTANIVDPAHQEHALSIGKVQRLDRIGARYGDLLAE